MKEKMNDIFKWWLVICFAAIAFYVVCPKYSYHSGLRLNTITGEVCKPNMEAKKWVNLFK